MSSSDTRFPRAGTHAATVAVDRPVGRVEIDANGQATYRIPIAVPPGVAGLQPTLELVYRHRVPNGVLGVGWTLAGLSAITRVKATYATDGFNGAVTYGSADRFALDALRLVNVEGAYGAPGTLYFTEVQTWQHVRAGATPDAGFVVVTKSGDVREYGMTPDSRILAFGTSFVRVWALSAIVDRHGNRIEFVYTPGPDEGAPGAYYIAQIRYTARLDGMKATRFVDFEYEDRPDPIVGFVGGRPIVLSRRLRAVVVRVADDVVRTYALAYRTSKATAQSCIAQVTETGAASFGAAALPPTRFTWQDPEGAGFEVGPSSPLDQHPDRPRVLTMDVSGSGRTDLVQLWSDVDGVLHATTFLATPSPAGTEFRRATDSILGAFPETSEVSPADLDGDGKTDLIVAFRHEPDGGLRLAAFVSNGQGFTAAGVFDTGDVWDVGHLRFFAMDANGDGRTDFVEAYSHFDPDRGELLYFRSYLSKFGDADEALFTLGIVSPTDDPARVPEIAFWPMDVNGNGMMDLVRVWSGTDNRIVATAYVGVSLGVDSVSFGAKVRSELGTFNPAGHVALLPIDVNGDGLQDLVHLWEDRSGSGPLIHFTTFSCDGAGAFSPGATSSFADETLSAASFDAMDIDGNGSTAIVKRWISGNQRLMFIIFRTSLDGRFRASAPFDAGPAPERPAESRFFAGDVNGDGKADLVHLSLDAAHRVVAVPYTSAGPFPDVVATIVNPLGGVATLEYAPLSDPRVYDPTGDVNFPSAPGRRYANPLTPTQYPFQAVLGRATYVVSKVTETTDPAVNRLDYHFVRTLRYAGASLDLLGRGWQGFATVTCLDEPSLRRTTTAYNQSFPLTGTVASTRIEEAVSAESASKAPVATTLRVASSKYVARGARSASSIVEVLCASSRVDRYAAGVLDSSIGETYAYDGYGNPTTIARLGKMDPETLAPLVPSEVVYRHRLYRNDVGPGGWALGYPLYEKVTANATDPDVTRFLPGDYRLERREYTATYDLASAGRWDDTRGTFSTTTYAYDEFGQPTIETKPGERTTRTEYAPDDPAYPMRVTSPPNAQGVSIVSAVGYDPRFGVEVARLDPNGFVWITALDAFGRAVAQQGPVPDVSGAESDPNLVTDAVTGAEDLRRAFREARVVTLGVTKYLDDGRGGLLRSRGELQSFPTDVRRELVWTDAYFDGRGWERASVRQTGQERGDVVVFTDFDDEMRITRRSLPFFSKSTVVAHSPYAVTWTYDAVGRPRRREVPSGADGRETAVTTWEYERDARVRVTSAAGSDAAYVEVLALQVLDGEERVRSSTVDPGGSAAVSRFEYDAIGRLVAAVDPPTVTSPNGVRNAITYDALDRKKTLDNPDQNTTNDPSARAMTYEYDAVTGAVSSQTDAAGQRTVFSYDALGRVTARALPDGRTIATTYDDPAALGAGRVTRVVTTLPNGTIETQLDFRYDAYGNTVAERTTIADEPAPFTVISAFDPQHRTIRQRYPDDTVLTRRYAFGQLVAQSLDGAVVDYPLDQHSEWEQPGEIDCGRGALPGSGIMMKHEFSPIGELVHEVVVGPEGVAVDLAYQRDRLGQTLAVHDAGDGTSAAVFTYVNKRLKTAAVAGFPAGGFEYDASGNLTVKDGVAYTCRAHFAAGGRAGGAEVYRATPDACGRTSSQSANATTLRFAYDGLGLLERVSVADGAVLQTNLHDGTGRLVREVDEAGAVTLHVGSAYAVTRLLGGRQRTTKYVQDGGGAIAAVTRSVDLTGAQILYFRRDPKGSTTHAFGAGGAVVRRIAYDAWGAPAFLHGDASFGPKYEQREWRAAVGLYAFGARYYDPARGRFLTPDTDVGAREVFRSDALNRFAFELNNPIAFVDPTGHSAEDVLNVVGGVAIGLLLVAGGIAFPVFLPTALGVAFGAGLVGAGINGLAYSATHYGVERFRYGYVANALVGFGTWAVVGVVGFGIGQGVDLLAQSLVVVSRGGQFALRAAAYAATGSPLASAGDVLNQLAANGIDRDVLALDVALDDGLARAAVTGAVFGTLGGSLQALGETRYLRKFLPQKLVDRWRSRFSEEEVARRIERRNKIVFAKREDQKEFGFQYEEDHGRLVSRFVLSGVAAATAGGDALVEWLEAR